MNPVFVIGHRNPDTDSICSAICYAHLKRRLTGGEYIACRAGHVNAETKFVLERFGVEPPRYIKSFEPRLSDVQYREVPGISEELSLHRAWDYMNENDIQTLAVVDEDRRLKGLLTLGDIARFYIEDQDANALAEAKTSYRNLVDVLDGTLEVGDIDQRFEQGSVVVAAANPDVLEDYIGKNDMVILGNRYESQLCAIEMSAGCIVIGLGSKVSRTIRKLASENGVSIIATPYDTYTCVKVIGQAVPVRHVMRKKGLITFEPEETVEDVKRTVSKKRIRYYPLMDEQGRYVGMFSQRNLLDLERPSVILVDHNERDQAAEGIRSTNIVEIIDHHRIDSVRTFQDIDIIQFILLYNVISPLLITYSSFRHLSILFQSKIPCFLSHLMLCISACLGLERYLGSFCSSAYIPLYPADSRISRYSQMGRSPSPRAM